MTTLAQRLWDARAKGHAVAMQGLPAPTTLDESYTVQLEIARLSGHAVKGYKVGSTSAEAQRILGTTEPGWGLLLAPYVYGSPAEVAITPAHSPMIEGEFAFRLARDLAARDKTYEREEVADAIDAIAGAIEVVGTRLEGGLAGKGRFLVTADGGANIAFVAGKWHEDWRALDIVNHPVAVTINDKPGGHGTGARALGDPMNVMVWLANRLSQRGEGLKAGAMVTTGTCTGIDTVKPGDVVAADFGSLGTVEISFR